MEKIRIAMADDHSMVREATCAALSRYPDFEITGEAADGEQALEMVLRVRPDILLLDVRMPATGGLEVLPRLKEASPETKVMILSAYDDDEYVLGGVKGGARGYLLKSIDLDELAQSIRTVHLGQTVFDPSVASKIVSSHAEERPSGRLSMLSNREREIMAMVSDGLDNKDIAARFGLSVRTVEGHLGRIYGKLGVSSRADAVRVASEAAVPDNGR